MISEHDGATQAIYFSRRHRQVSLKTHRRGLKQVEISFILPFKLFLSSQSMKQYACSTPEQMRKNLSSKMIATISTKTTENL